MSIRLSVDLDGVLSQFLEHVLLDINGIYGTAYQAQDFPSWNLERHLPPDQASRYISLTQNPDVFENLEIYPEASNSLARIRELDVEIHIRSSRQAHIYEATRNWLRKHSIEYVTLDVSPTAKPDFANLHDEKNPLWMIDDDQAVISMLKLPRPEVRLYLLDRPYNQVGDIPGTRIFSWEPLIEDLEGRTTK